jgi:hypothetical protein
MHRPRKRALLNILFGSLLAGVCACGNEPVKHSEDLPKGRIPQMSEQQILESKKKQQASEGKKQTTSTQPKYIGGLKQPTVSPKQLSRDRGQPDKKSKKQGVDD